MPRSERTSTRLVEAGVGEQAHRVGPQQRLQECPDLRVESNRRHRLVDEVEFADGEQHRCLVFVRDDVALRLLRWNAVELVVAGRIGEPAHHRIAENVDLARILQTWDADPPMTLEMPGQIAVGVPGHPRRT